MTKQKFLILCFVIAFMVVSAQNNAEYVRANAVRISNIDKLGDSVFKLLDPFQIIMFGEMHGTNESAPFVSGLTELFLSKGDSVQVGMEIPDSQMSKFISLRTDSSIYHSDFFYKLPQASGRESMPWAGIISRLKDNPRVRMFFFDIEEDEGKLFQRDSLMGAKIKTQYQKHPSWKMITLSGNYHNRISGEPTMASYLLRDKRLKICTLNMEYSGGTCRANFGKGLEIKQLSCYPSPYNSTLAWDKFLLLVSAGSGYQYHGFYYTKEITAATLTPHE